MLPVSTCRIFLNLGDTVQNVTRILTGNLQHVHAYMRSGRCVFVCARACILTFMKPTIVYIRFVDIFCSEFQPKWPAV
jgi:hypothetical protein